MHSFSELPGVSVAVTFERFRYLDPKCIWHFHNRSGCASYIDVSFDCDVDELNNFFACAVPSNVLNNNHIGCDTLLEFDNSFSFNCVSMDDVVHTFDKVKSKSIGVDSIPLEFLKHIFPYI